MILYLLALVFPLAVFSQEAEKSLPTENEFKSLVLNMKVPVSANETKVNENLQRYLANLQKNFGTLGGSTDVDNSQVRELRECVMKNQSHFDRNPTAFCQDVWKRVSAENKNFLKQKGILPPDEYERSLQSKVNDKNKSLKEYAEADEVIVIADPMTLSEITPATLQSMQEIDPNIKSLSFQVQKILLKMNTNQDPVAVSKSTDLKGDADAKMRLLELTQMLSLIRDESNSCWTDGTVKKMEGEDFIFGLPNAPVKAKGAGYYFKQGNKSWYLYPVRDGQIGDETWVLGQIDENGNMTFRYYSLTNDQKTHIELSDDDDIKLIKGQVQKTTLGRSDRKLYLQTQTGLTIKGSETKLPVIGKAIIPDSKIMIGKVEANYLSKRVLVANNVTVSSQEISFSNQTSPVANNFWSLGSGVRYNPLNGQMEVNGNVMVYDLMVGYTDHLNGKRSGQVGYVFNRNFVQVNTDFEHMTTSVGRQLPKGRGYMMGQTDFRSVHQVKVVIFLD